MASSPVILDWQADRLRAWMLYAGASPRPVVLDENETTLPLLISMAERRLQLGKPGYKLIRLQPHQVMDCFVPYLGMDRCWQYRRHTLDSRDGFALVLQKIKDRLPGKSVLHVVPSYWNREQAALLEDQTRQAGLRSLGSIKRGLVLSGLSPGLTIDVDSYAATITQTKLQSRSGGLQYETTQTLTDLAIPIWSERIAGLVASRCLQDYRRDPRASGETDQQLFEQIRSRLPDWASQQDARIHLKQRDWQDELPMHASDVQTVCSPLAHRLAQYVAARKESENWFLSPEAGALPGLPQALYQVSMNQKSVSILPQELMPMALTNWACHIEQGLLQPPHLAETMPAISEIPTEHQPDTLPFMKRYGKK